MFFSVIVPVYKVEEYLRACVESVLNQTFSDFELILVNDGSPDACPQICEEYAKKDARVKVLHKENGGLASARRAGIQIAQGDYVYNLDSDDRIEPDTLGTAFNIIQRTDCEIVSFGYQWVQGGKTVRITDDCLPEGLYTGADIEKHIYPKILMDPAMNHLSFYLAGKAIKRTFLTPIQLSVSESITLGEDLCCVVPCYLHAQSVYISKKNAYLYSIRDNSLSKEFNAAQIHLIENVIKEICAANTEKIPDFEEQLNRYSCFMCFAILAAAAEGNHFNKIKEIKKLILRSTHADKIARANFQSISPKSRIAILLMKKRCYRLAFYFLNLCKLIKGR